MTTSHELPTTLQRAAETVAERGIDALDNSVIDTIAARALMLGASPVLVDVAVDPAEPSVARLRAFGKLTMFAARPLGEFTLAA